MFKLFSKAIYGVLLLYAFTSNVNAQEDIPVNLLTGTAYVSIPLGNVSDNGINVPIVLNYTTTGVRVDEYEDWVGLGWALNPGGLISREVRGLPDDYQGGASDTRLGWLHDSNTRQAVTNFDTGANEAAQWSEINSFYQNNKDTEPDLFYFNFAGGSGQFVFDKDGNIRLLSFSNLLIVFDGVDFTITDNSGVKYFFKTKETVTKQAAPVNLIGNIELMSREYQLYKDALTYTSGWRLTKIESPEGGLVQFDYMTNTFEYETPVEVVAKEYNTTNYAVNKLYTINFDKEVKLLEYIHSDVNSAYFVHEFFNFKAAENNPLPRKNHSYKLYSIYFSKSVKGKTLPLNSISFEYDNKLSQKISGISSTRRFLKKVQSRKTCESLPPYEFEYNSISLPPHGSNDQDVWGFYTANNQDQNNIIGSYLYPKTYVYPLLDPEQRYRFTQIPNQANEIIIEGNDRSATSAAVAGVLKKILYPSGGSAELFYENNIYEEIIANQTITTNGPGVRVNKIVYEDGIPDGQLATTVSTAAITKYYSYGTGRLVHQPNYTIPSTYYHDRENAVERTKYQLLSDFGEPASWDYLTLRSTQSLTAFGGVQYESASTYQTGQGSVTNVYNVPAYYGINTHEDWQATTTRIVSNGGTDPDYGTRAGGTYSFPFPNNPNYGFERGQLIQKTMKAEDGKDVSLVDFTYDRLYKGADEYKVNGIYLDGILSAPDSTDYTFLFGKYDIRTEVGTVLGHSESKTFDTNDNTQFQTTTVHNIYGTGNHRLLKETVTTNPEGIKNTTSYKYAVDYVVGTTVTGLQSQMIKKLNDSNLGYRLVEKKSKLQYPSKAEKVIGGQLTLLKDYGDGIVRPYQQLLLKIGFGLTDFTDSDISNGVFDFDSRYEMVSTAENYNAEGAITSASDNKKHKSGFHYGYDNHYGVVAISNAYAENVVFSNFETKTGHHFTYLNNRYLGNQSAGIAHTGQQSLELDPADGLVATVDKDGNRAVFSTWYKAAAAGTLTLTLKTTDAVTTLHTESLSFDAANEGWKLIEKEIDVTSFPATYRIEVTTTSGSVVVDDVAFLPSKASIVTTTYDPINGKTSMISATGMTTYYSYDNLGRVKYVYDQDKNIVQANDYGFAKLDNTDKLSADFTGDQVGYNGLPTTFKANISECLSEPIYYSWKIETDLDQNPYTADDIIQVGSIIEGAEYSILTQTFNLDDVLFPMGEDSRYFKVTLEVTYPGQRQKSNSQVINIIRFEPPIVTICASGLLQMDICGIDADVVTTCNGIPTPNYGTTFGLSSITGGNPTAERTYQWQMKASGSSYWFSIGPLTTTSTSYTYENISESFDVRYIVKEKTYLLHTITSYSNAIHVEVYRSAIGCAPSNSNGQVE